MRVPRKIIVLPVFFALLNSGGVSGAPTYATVVDQTAVTGVPTEAVSELHIGQDAIDPSILRISGYLFLSDQLDCGPNRNAGPCTYIDLQSPEEIEAFRADLEELLGSLKRELDQGTIKSIRLNSVGGTSGIGLAMAALITDYSIDTYVESDAICASACVEIFMAGKNRIADGTIAVHGEGTVNGRELSPLERLTKDQITTLRKSIRQSTNWPTDLIELADSTPFDRLAVLTKEGKAHFGLLSNSTPRN